MGLDTKKILEAASDRYQGTIDAGEVLLSQNFANVSIARVMSTGIYLSDNGVDPTDRTDLASQRLEIGEDTAEELDKALHDVHARATLKGLSPKGSERLSKLLMDYRDVFRRRIGSGPAAKVEPMRISLKSGAVPLLTKVRRYPPNNVSACTDLSTNSSCMGL